MIGLMLRLAAVNSRLLTGAVSTLYVSHSGPSDNSIHTFPMIKGRSMRKEAKIH